MENFTDRFIDKMLRCGVIAEGEKDSYRYAFAVKTEQLLTLSVILLIAWTFQKVIPTMLFLLFFWLIRKRSGGYHLKSFLGCFLGTMCIYVFWAKVFAPFLLIQKPILYVMFAVAVVTLEVIGAVNHPNMDWTKDEYAAGKQMTREIVLFETAIIVTTALLGADMECVMYMMFGVILSAFLLLLAKVAGQDVS